MTIGAALLLIAVGAILRFAVQTVSTHGIDLHTIGDILMIIGVVGPIEDAGRTLAGVAIAVGAMETVWYLFVEPPLTSDGQFVLAAAVGTLLGGTMWRRSAAVSAALHGGSELPHAQVRRS